MTELEQYQLQTVGNSTVLYGVATRYGKENGIF